MKKLLILGMLATGLYADIAVEPWGTAYHWNRDKNYNESNQYVGVVYRYQQYDLGVTTFINSHNDRSNSIYVGYREPISEYVNMVGGVGYVSGYEKFNIIGGVGFDVTYEDTYLKLAVNPKYMGITVGYIFRTGE